MCVDLLVNDGGDRLAAGEAELHDVGELAAGVVHGDVVGRDQTLQSLGQGLELNEAAGAAVGFRREHLNALWSRRPVACEYLLDVSRL